MKKIVMALLVAGICAAPSIASAETDSYISVSAGLGLMHNQDIKLYGISYDDAIEFNSGLALEGALGTRSDNYRAEFAVGYQSSDMDKAFGVTINDYTISDINVSTLSYMLNCYKDFHLDGGVSPYLMGGVGAATVSSTYDYQDIHASSDDTVFAYQLGAGVYVDVSDDLAVDLGYRYFATDEAAILLDSSRMTMESSRILLGMRFRF
ncbi:outer membrane beta-barrel protein [Chlorobium sp. N1]|uniref:outer membrane protein n=1 Tax=Chlorobium sp. N1 TaxID=2491138 RepID=UPI00103CCAC9|nr:outer membrane beta-barrel protein [Chlorobium sp. N1]TCD47319.1 porin family protein [Chlorobium sp. N1]